MLNAEQLHSELLCLIPAAGKGTRLRPLTDTRVKPSLAIAFRPEKIIRMIDLPLEAVRQVGGVALATTHYAADTLEFVNQYPHAGTLPVAGFQTPIDSIMDNRALFQNAEIIGVIPGDSRLTPRVFEGMLNMFLQRDSVAVLLGTAHLGGHNKRPVDKHNHVVKPGSHYRYLADLGIHLVRKEWLFDRIAESHHKTTDVDIWQDIYTIDAPIAEVSIYAPEDGPSWVDMGTPSAFRATVYDLNNRSLDRKGNIIFPEAQLTTASADTIALPFSQSTVDLRHAIVPEGSRINQDNYEEGILWQ